MSRPGARILSAVIVAISILAPARAGFYVTDLGMLPGGTATTGSGINRQGTIVGTATIGVALQRGFVGGTSSPVDLGTLPGGRTSAGFGINEFGLTTGDAEIKVDNVFRTHMFRSQGSGGLTDMGVLGTDVNSAGRGINSAGHVAGWSVAANGTSRAVIAYAPNTFQVVGDLGGLNSQAYAINDADTVTGEADTSTGFRHAFRTKDGVTADLGTLAGSVGSSGRAINGAGDVAGFTTGAVSHAFLAPANGGPLVDLGVLPFTSSSRALGINDKRQVVGESGADGQDSTAFLWLPSSLSTGPARMYDLNLLIEPDAGWELLSAASINVNSQITGYGRINGEIHAFRLDPIPGQTLTDPPEVPETESLLLLLVGGLTITVRRLPQRLRRIRTSRVAAPIPHIRC